MANLQTGSKGADVKALQEKLAKAGFNPGNADGIYGPKTAAAVKAYQQSKGLKVDGIAGPKTMGSFGGASSAPAKPQTPVATNTPSQPGQTPTTQFDASNASLSNPKEYLTSAGWTSSDLQGVPDAMLPYLAAVFQYKTKQAEATGNAEAVDRSNLTDAIKAAYNDPDIQAKYGDAMRFGEQDLTQNIDYLNTAYNVDQANQAIQFRTQQNTLKEQEADAGRGYSGFRNRSQGDLDTIQSGIVTSKRNDLKNQVYNLGSQYERTFGSKALKKFGGIGVGGQEYDDLGNATGSLPLEQSAAQQNKAYDIFKNQFGYQGNGLF